MPQPEFQSTLVAARFLGYPALARKQLLEVRHVIFAVAKNTSALGGIEESLKWGEPAYRPRRPRTGTTVRIDWKASMPTHCALYFHCQTTLVGTFQSLFGDDFRFEGNRALLLEVGAPIPKTAVAFCINAAFTYHLQRDVPAPRAAKRR